MRILYFLLCTCLLLLCSLPVQSQSPLNGGFEDSTFVVGDTMPTHWSMDYFGATLTPDAHSGNAAVSIWNWYYYGRGWLCYGDAQSSMTGGGLPIAFNPDQLDGWYKYIYGDNDNGLDSAVCEILVYSHQGFTGARDTIAFERVKLGPATDYTAFHIPIHYTMVGMLADTILVRFISSDSGMCAVSGDGVCLYLTVDDIEVSTAAGLHQSLDAVPMVSIYPSPSAHGFKVAVQDHSLFPALVELHDLSGRMVYSTSVMGTSGQAIEPHLPPGTYLWTVTSWAGPKASGKWQCR